MIERFVAIKKLALAIAIVGGISVRAYSVELFGAANLLDEKAWSVGAYHTESEIEPVVEISGVNAIQVPTSGGSTTIFSGGNSEVEMEQESASNVLLLNFRPHGGFQYGLRLGQVSQFELQFSSGSQTNTLESTKDGFVWGLNLGKTIAVGSIVSTAISWDLSYTNTRVDLDRFQGGPVAAVPASQKLNQDEFQAAVNFSRRWKMIEPYAGVKVSSVKTTLKDKTTKESVSGRTEGVSPFVGLEFSFFGKEMLIVEASFVDQKSISAGLNIQF